MVAEGTIGLDDLRLMLVTDSIDEATAHIRRYAIDAFGLRLRVFKPSPLFGERPTLTATDAASGGLHAPRHGRDALGIASAAAAREGPGPDPVPTLEFA